MWFLVSSLPDRISVNHKQITSIHSWQEVELYSAGGVAECTVVRNVDHFPGMQRCPQRQSWCRGQFSPPQRTEPWCGLFPAMSPRVTASFITDSRYCHWISQSFPNSGNCWRAHRKHTTPRERSKFSDRETLIFWNPTHSNFLQGPSQALTALWSLQILNPAQMDSSYKSWFGTHRL